MFVYSSPKRLSQADDNIELFHAVRDDLYPVNDFRKGPLARRASMSISTK
jgi:hypothetical protein